MFYRLFLNELNISLKEAKFSSTKGIVDTERQHFLLKNNYLIIQF